MYLVIVIGPLLGAIVAGGFGRKLGEEGAIRVTTWSVGGVMLMSMYGMYEVGVCGEVIYVRVGKWMESEAWNIKWGMMYDSLTVVMLVVVTVVSWVVHIYSMEYMKGDPHRGRFSSYLSLFTFFMLVLVTADNYVQMFVGWEGVGLCSYLLINFWYTRIKANKAAIQAMIVNRVGDIGLALGIAGVYKEYRTVEYGVVFGSGQIVGSSLEEKWGMMMIGLLLFIGAVGKSAQIGLHTWLPNAMEGPTPVSALIHAATMVTAGVFVLARSSPILEYVPEVLGVVTVIGGMTAIFAGTTGLFQNDIKKVIAYSTASQLGYMVVACGLSAYAVGIFHLANHAFFKALLFLSAGAVIHGMSDEQDVRRMGGLVKVMPYTYAMMFIGSIALMGIPFMTGYYSKDVIMEVAYLKSETSMGRWAYGLGSLAALCTGYYSMRILQLGFLSPVSGNKKVIEEAHEPAWRMLVPLGILSIGSIGVGYISRELIIGVGTDFWGNAIFTHPENMVMLEGEFLPVGVKWVPVICGICGGVGAWVVYNYSERGVYRVKMSRIGRRIYKLGNRKWYFDKVYTEWIAQGVLDKGYKVTYKGVDKGVLELLGPKGIGSRLYEKGYELSKIQSGHVYHYMIVMIVGVIGYMCYTL